MVTLVREGYFTKNILPLLQSSASNLTEAHSLFWLSAANNQVMPVLKYFEADINLLGFKIPPGVVRCDLIWLGCEEFRKVHGFEAFETFHCPEMFTH